MDVAVATLGKRGTFVIPANFRRYFGLHEGDLMIAENHSDGILLRPAVALPIEHYSKERKAEFLLSNATDSADYLVARKVVTGMGLDPDSISHYAPKSQLA